MRIIVFCFLVVYLPFKGIAQDDKKMTMDLNEIFQSYAKNDEPGFAVLIAKEGKIVYQNAFGIADIDTKEKITTQTIFNTGSISKTFVAYGILKLASEGRLSLEDDLYRYFPDFINADIARKVRIYHLLTHSSGLPDSRRVKEEHDFYLVARDEENFAPLKNTETLQFEPGTSYRYSNPAFNGLALIIEKLTADRWQDYIIEKIFKPSGMSLSTITDGPHPTRGVSHAYILNNKKEFEECDYGEEPTFAAAGNGGIWSSVEELWKYEQAIQQYLFLDEEWIKKSRTVYPLQNWKDSLPSKLGLSWYLNNEANGKPMIGHTGSQGGFRGDYCWIPDQKVFYVFLSNTPKPLAEIRRKVFSIILK